MSYWLLWMFLWNGHLGAVRKKSKKGRMADA